MPQTQITTTRAGLPALLDNLARRFKDAAPVLFDVDTMLNGDVVVRVSWPRDFTDPGDPGPNPELVALREQLRATRHQLEQADVEIDGLTAQLMARDEADRAKLEAAAQVPPPVE